MGDTVLQTNVVLVPQSGTQLNGLLKDIHSRFLQLSWRPQPSILSVDECISLVARKKVASSPQENTLLILESFKHRRLVESHNQLNRIFVFGCPAISFFLERRAPFPNCESPIWSVAFFGCEVCTSGLSNDDRRRIEKQLRWLGATVSRAYHNELSFVFSDDTQTRKYHAAAEFGTTCLQSAAVGDAYVRSCADSSFRLRCALDSAVGAAANGDENEISSFSQLTYASQTGQTQTLVDRVDVSQRESILAFIRKWRTGIFSKLEICTSKLYDDTKVRIRQLVEAGGGVYRGDLQASCTHLVMDEPGGEKYDFAKSTSRILIVRSNWIFDSATRGYCLDPAQYALDAAPQVDQAHQTTTPIATRTNGTNGTGPKKRTMASISAVNMSVSFNNVCASSRIEDPLVQDNVSEASPFRRPLAPAPADRDRERQQEAPNTTTTTTTITNAPPVKVTVLQASAGKIKQQIFATRNSKGVEVRFAIATSFDVAKRVELATQLLEHGAAIVDLFSDRQLTETVASQCELTHGELGGQGATQVVLLTPLVLDDSHLVQLALQGKMPQDTELRCVTAGWLARCLHTRQWTDPVSSLDVPVLRLSSAAATSKEARCSSKPVRGTVVTLTGFEDYEMAFIKENVRQSSLPLLFQFALAKGREDAAPPVVRRDDRRLDASRDVEDLLRDGVLSTSQESLSETRLLRSGLSDSRAANRTGDSRSASALALRTDVLVCSDQVVFTDVLRTSKKTVAARKWGIPVLHTSWMLESLRRDGASLIGVLEDINGEVQKSIRTDDQKLREFDAEAVAREKKTAHASVLLQRSAEIAERLRNLATVSDANSTVLQGSTSQTAIEVADTLVPNGGEEHDPRPVSTNEQSLILSDTAQPPPTSHAVSLNEVRSPQLAPVSVGDEEVAVVAADSTNITNATTNGVACADAEQKFDVEMVANASGAIHTASPGPVVERDRDRVSLSSSSLCGTPRFVDSPNSVANAAGKRAADTPPICDILNNVLVGRLRKQPRIEVAVSPLAIDSPGQRANATCIASQNESALLNDSNLPQRSNDVPPLRGVRLAFARSFTDPQRVSDLMSIARRLGAEVLLAFDTRCTHLVYEAAQTGSSRKTSATRVPKDVAAALDASRIVVSPYWLLDTAKTDQRLSERDYPFTYNPSKSLPITGAPSIASRRSSQAARRGSTPQSQSRSSIELRPNPNMVSEPGVVTGSHVDHMDVKMVQVAALDTSNVSSHADCDTPPLRRRVSARNSRTQPNWASSMEVDAEPRLILSDTVAAANYDSSPSPDSSCSGVRLCDSNANPVPATARAKSAQSLNNSMRSPATTGFARPTSTTPRANTSTSRSPYADMNVTGTGQFEVIGIEQAAPSPLGDTSLDRSGLLPSPSQTHPGASSNEHDAIRITELIDHANKTIWCAQSSASSANDSHPPLIASLPLSTQSPTVCNPNRQLNAGVGALNRSVADQSEQDAATVTWNTDAEIQNQRARARLRRRNDTGEMTPTRSYLAK